MACFTHLYLWSTHLFCIVLFSVIFSVITSAKQILFTKIFDKKNLLLFSFDKKGIDRIDQYFYHRLRGYESWEFLVYLMIISLEVELILFNNHGSRSLMKCCTSGNFTCCTSGNRGKLKELRFFLFRNKAFPILNIITMESLRTSIWYIAVSSRHNHINKKIGNIKKQITSWGYET
jgi:hypothetical protein